MPKHHLQLETQDPPYLLTLIVDHSPYDEGAIALIFATAEQASTIHRELNEYDLNTTCDNNICIIRDFANCRVVYEKLQSNLSHGNQSIITNFIRRVIEVDIKSRKGNSYEINQAQTAVLLDAVASLFIVDIFSVTNKHDVIEVLLGFAFSSQSVNFDRYLQAHSIDVSVKDSILALQRITQGRAEMESTLKRMSATDSIPSLQLQRIILRDTCLQYFHEKFTDMSLGEQLIFHVTLQFYSMREFNLVPINIKQIIIQAMNHQIPISPAGGFLNIVSTQIDLITNNAVIKICNPENNPFDDGFFKKVEDVAASLRNPFALSTCIANLRIIQSQQDVEDNHPLLAALKHNDPNEVRLVFLRSPELLNQYLPNGSDIFQTPIAYANQRCSLEVMQVLIDHRADVNIPTRRGETFSYTCLTSAINSVEPDKVWLLLVGEANVHAQSHILSSTPAWHRSVKFTALQASSLQLASHNYLQNKDKPFLRSAILLQINYAVFMNEHSLSNVGIPLVRNLFDMVYHCPVEYYDKLKSSISNLMIMLSQDNLVTPQCSMVLKILNLKPNKKLVEPCHLAQPGNIREVIDRLAKQLSERLGDDLVGSYKTLFDLLNQFKFAEAIKYCCALPNEALALDLLNIIFSSQDKMVIDIHQRSGTPFCNALDIAEENGQSKIHALLTKFAFNQLNQQVQQLLPKAPKATTSMASAAPFRVVNHDDLKSQFEKIFGEGQVKIFFNAFNKRKYQQALLILCGNSLIPHDQRMDALRLLLENKDALNIDVNQSNRIGKTPLYFAATVAGRDTYDLLDQHGADTTQRVLGKTIAEHLEDKFPQATPVSAACSRLA